MPNNKKASFFAPCLAPWHACFIHPDGSIRPCCVFTKPLGFLQDGDTISSVWNKTFKPIRRQILNNEIPEGCRQCYGKEEKGFRSRRNFFSERFSTYSDEHIIKFLNEEKTEVEPIENIVYLDFSLSNDCNLRCRFCGPHNSTRWERDAKKLIKESPDSFWKDIFDFHDSTKVSKSNEYLSLIPKLPLLRDIDINGGEPLFTKDARELIKNTANSSVAKNVRLNLTTNGTIVPIDLKPSFQKFKEVVVTISVDGTGQMYQYMRGDSFTLEKDIISAIDFYSSIENCQVTFRFTLCALNVFQISPVFRWHQLIKKRFSNIGEISYGLVMKPRELRISNLPEELRASAINELDTEEFPELLKLKNSLRAAGSEECNYLDFKRYVLELDTIRDQSIQRIQPEFTNFFTKGI